MTLDRDLLDAFLPEFGAEAARLATARDAASAARVLDQLRAMAAALGAPSLSALVERAGLLLDPLDLPALQAAAEALAERARVIGTAGADVGEPTHEPPPQPSPALREREPGALDGELIEAFLPEFEAACARLGTAGDATGAARAVAVLDGMAASLELGSLRAMLREVVLDPFDPAALPGLADALGGQARRIGEAGRDVEAALAGSPPRPSPAQERGSESTRRRVLVVDDSAMMRRLVREILALDPDFEVVGEAPDGRAALSAMAALQPELTMLDIEMPELDGIGVLRAWALRGPGEVVIVSSAARPGSATALLVRRLGAAGIVGKPSGALSPDLQQRQGEALLRTARRALGMAA